jgi:hypothetical protein
MGEAPPQVIQELKPIIQRSYKGNHTIVEDGSGHKLHFDIEISRNNLIQSGKGVTIERLNEDNVKRILPVNGVSICSDEDKPLQVFYSRFNEKEAVWVEGWEDVDQIDIFQEGNTVTDQDFKSFRCNGVDYSLQVSFLPDGKTDIKLF